MNSCLDQLKTGDVIEFYFVGTANGRRHCLVRTFSHWARYPHTIAVTLDGNEYYLRATDLFFTKIIKKAKC